MAKKSNKKVLYDVKTGTKVELPDDDQRAELMTIDDFVELMALQPKDPYPTEYVESIDIRADAFKWGFCAKYPYSLGQLDAD